MYPLTGGEHERAADPEIRRGASCPGPPEAPDRVEGRPFRLLAVDPDRLAHRGGRRRQELPRARLSDDLQAIRAIREAVGDDIRLMVDFNQGLTLGDAL